MEPPGRSTRPMEPANSTSPENSSSSSQEHDRATRVAGRVSHGERQPANLNPFPVPQLTDIVRFGGRQNLDTHHRRPVGRSDA